MRTEALLTLTLASILTAACSNPTSPSSTSVAAPTDGVFPYTLIISPADACSLGTLIPGGTGIPIPLHPPELAFDSELRVSGNRLQLALPQDLHVSGQSGHGLTLDIQRSGNTLSGTIGGGYSKMRNSPWTLGIWQTSNGPFDSLPGVFSGSSDAQGTLTGVFRAFVELIQFFDGDYADCNAQQFSWSLMPATSRITTTE